MLHRDNGPKFVSAALLEGGLLSGVCNLHTESPEKSQQNGANESFIGKIKGECLAMTGFTAESMLRVIPPYLTEPRSRIH